MELDRVVVGMDFSEPAMKAAQWTSRHLAPTAGLVLVHSVEVPPAPEFLADILPPREARLERARKDAERPMRELSHALDTGRVRTEIREGRPAEQITEVAVETGAALIVVGDRGHHPAFRTLLGSTAEYLVRCSPMPVLVARSLPDGGPRSILVPVGESQLGTDALRWALFLRDRFAAQVTALHVLSSGLYGVYRLVRSEVEANRMEARAREAANAWVEEKLRAADFPEASATVQIAFGEPGFEVVASAERTGADMIVMGNLDTRTRRPVLLGGVADAVLHGSSLPVLIVTAGICD